MRASDGGLISIVDHVTLCDMLQGASSMKDLVLKQNKSITEFHNAWHRGQDIVERIKQCYLCVYCAI